MLKYAMHLLRCSPILGLIGNLCVLLIMLSICTAPLAAETPQQLRLGIMPFNSTLALIKTHNPLRLYLQKELGQSVDI